MAASDLGVLTVYMSAVTDQFHAGLQGAEKAITSFRGKIKGLNRTFTEVKSKVHVIAGAFESAFKGVEIVTKLWKGDMEDASDIIKSLPLGLGQAMTAYESMLKSVLGITAHLDHWAMKIHRMDVHFADLTKRADDFRSAMDKSEKSSASLLQQISLVKEEYDHGAEAAAKMQRGFARGDAVKALKDQILETSKLREGHLASVKAFTQSDFLDKLSSMGVGDTDVVGSKTVKEYERKRAAADRAKVEITRQDKILAGLRTQLKMTKGLHSWGEKLAQQHIDDAAAAKAAAAADRLKLDNARDLAKARRELSEAQQSAARIAGRGLQGAVNTFRSPMGTISLPALNTTAELARLQLTELRAIDQTITGLEATIKDLTKP
tara:strand:+ start:388 stop:1521 length:1134 start_codon:yes stop_codon:yes gene_type:complete